MSAANNFLSTVLLYALILMSPGLFTANTATSVYATTVIYILGALSLWVINKKTTERPTFDPQKNVTSLKIIGWGIAGFVLVIFVQLIARLIETRWLGLPYVSENTENIAKVAKEFPIFLYAVAIGGPIMEEFVFRFSLINYLEKKITLWGAAIVSSLLFAAAHMDGHYLLYFSMGFCFFLLYKKTGSIYTAIISHGLMNLVALIFR